MLKLDIINNDAILSLAKAVQEMNAKQTNELMKSISGSLLAAVEENFENEGRPKWKDLDPITKSIRAKSGNWPGKILQRTGDLRRSITQHWSDNLAVVGTNKIYARIQQHGGTIHARKAKALRFGSTSVKSVRIPSREFLKLTETDLQELTTDINRWYGDILRREGLL